MPQKLPKKLARQLDKTLKSIEKKEESTQQESTPAPVAALDQIPEDSFRHFDANYKAYADAYKAKYYQNHPEQYEEPDEYTTGYLSVVPLAPGTQIDIGSADYPRVNGADFSAAEAQKVVKPIIVIRNTKDVDRLVKLKLLKESEAMRKEAAEFEFNDKSLWILPNGKSILCPRNAKSLQDVVEQRQMELQKESNKKLDDTDSPAPKKMTEEQFYSKIKKWFYLLLLGIGLFLGVYFSLQHRYWGQTIGGKPVQQYLKRLGLKPSATPDEIKKAYRGFALKLHPDRNPGCSDCEARFGKIAEAYKYLLEHAEGVEPAKIPTILDDDNDWLAHQPRKAAKK